MNRLLSGQYRGWRVPAGVLQSYQEKTSVFRQTINPPKKKSEYLVNMYMNVFLNVYPESPQARTQVSSNVDMKIGNQIIAHPTSSHPRGSHPRETSQIAEIQLCNTPGAGTKLIGFVIVYGNPRVINTVAEQTGQYGPLGKGRKKLLRSNFLDRFWINLVQTKAIDRIASGMLPNWNLAIRLLNNRLLEQAKRRSQLKAEARKPLKSTTQGISS
ncbi:hypothetical protein F5880DRAFT_820954 [Lentinula raphanica]|nr:hypothetical protein F5880DRAFT_820954 [Lentinula raphanica]